MICDHDRLTGNKNFISNTAESSFGHTGYLFCFIKFLNCHLLTMICKQCDTFMIDDRGKLRENQGIVTSIVTSSYVTGELKHVVQ